MATSVADFNVFESFLIDFKQLTDHFQEEELLVLCDIMEICGHGPDATDEQRTCLYGLSTLLRALRTWESLPRSRHHDRIVFCVVPAKDPLVWNLAMSQAASSAVRAGHAATHVRYWMTTDVITKPESLSFASWMHISQARLSLAAQWFRGWQTDCDA